MCRSAQHAGMLKETEAGYLVDIFYSNANTYEFASSEVNSIASKSQKFDTPEAA